MSVAISAFNRRNGEFGVPLPLSLLPEAVLCHSCLPCTTSRGRHIIFLFLLKRQRLVRRTSIEGRRLGSREWGDGCTRRRRIIGWQWARRVLWMDIQERVVRHLRTWVVSRGRPSCEAMRGTRRKATVASGRDIGGLKSGNGGS